MLAPQVVEQPHDLGLVSPLQPDTQFGHVEHAVIGLEGLGDAPQFAEQVEFADRGFGPLLEHAVGLPAVFRRRVTTDDDRLGRPFRRPIEARVDGRDQHAAELVEIDLRHVEAMPTQRWHALEGLFHGDRGRGRHAEPRAHGRPCIGGVAATRSGLALGDERLDAAGALCVGQRLSRRLAEQLRQRRLGPALDEPRPEGLLLPRHEGVEEARAACRRGCGRRLGGRHAELGAHEPRRRRGGRHARRRLGRRERAAEELLGDRLRLRHVGREALQHRLRLAVGLPPEDEQRGEHAGGAVACRRRLVDTPYRSRRHGAPRHPARAVERRRLAAVVVAELVFEQFQGGGALLAGADGQRGDDARERHQRRAVGIGLGLQRDRPARGLDGVVVGHVPQLCHRQPGLRRFERSGHHLAEHGDVGEQFPALAGHGLEAAEGRQRLGQPPLVSVLERRVELGPPGRVGRGRREPHLRAQRGRDAGGADDRGQQPTLLVGAETTVEEPLHDALREAHMAELGPGLHERRRDAHEFGRDVVAAFGTAGGQGRDAGLVEQRGRLLHAAGDGVGDGRLAEGERVLGMGVEKRLARHGGLGELLGAEFQLRPRGHQAGPARILVGQAPHLIERRRDLVALDEPIELLQVADEVGAAELDLLAGTSRAGCVGIDRHGKIGSGSRVAR